MPCHEAGLMVEMTGKLKEEEIIDMIESHDLQTIIYLLPSSKAGYRRRTTHERPPSPHPHGDTNVMTRGQATYC